MEERMSRPAPIQIDTDTWIIMREHPTQPKAVVSRVIDTAGEARFLLMVWHAVPAKRRMHGIYGSLEEAERAVPWDSAAALKRAAESVGPFQGYPKMGNMPRAEDIKLAQSAPDRHP